MNETLPIRRNRGYQTKISQTLHDLFLADFQSALENSLVAAIPYRDLVYKLEYQKRMWLSKLSDSTTTPALERRKAAIDKWLLAEVRNTQTNSRLLVDECRFYNGVSSATILKFARSVIRQLIGDAPDSLLIGEFTNGASTRVKRAPDAIARKFVGKAHATPEAWEVFKTHVLPTSPVWVSAMMAGAFRPSFQHGSMMFTVPKNSDIDRVACKEPEINMFLQRGAGLYLRSALKGRGIDLTDQTSNQRLAHEGSVSGKLATLDLSSASDLISTQLVYDLLPLDWFLYLDAIRVKRVLIDGEWHELNMFSSMGNGFTFELESLLFYALSCAINRAYGVRGRISVYGDDIITPSAAAAVYPSVFSWFGFKINFLKSFWRGPFRESCGKHYYRGFDVTPFFLRDRIADLEVLMHQLNQLRAWATREGDDFWTPELYSLWEKWSRHVPRKLHGGKNTEDKSCLATPGLMKYRLQAEKRELMAPPLGAYLQWLLLRSTQQVKLDVCIAEVGSVDVSFRRDYALRWLDTTKEDPFVTSEVALELSFYRLVKHRVWDRKLDHLWFAEYAS